MARFLGFDPEQVALVTTVEHGTLICPLNVLDDGQRAVSELGCVVSKVELVFLNDPKLRGILPPTMLADILKGIEGNKADLSKIRPIPTVWDRLLRDKPYP